MREPLIKDKGYRHIRTIYLTPFRTNTIEFYSQRFKRREISDFGDKWTHDAINFGLRSQNELWNYNCETIRIYCVCAVTGSRKENATNLWTYNRVNFISTRPDCFYWVKDLSHRFAKTTPTARISLNVCA